jgi:hypothetical protein
MIKTTFMKKHPLIIFLIIYSLIAYTQQKVKDGTVTPATSMPTAGNVVELQSTQAGLRLAHIDQQTIIEKREACLKALGERIK